MDNLDIIETLSSFSAFEKNKIDQWVKLLCTNLGIDQYEDHHKLRDKMSKVQKYADVQLVYADVQADFNFLNRTQ